MNLGKTPFSVNPRDTDVRKWVKDAVLVWLIYFEQVNRTSIGNADQVLRLPVKSKLGYYCCFFASEKVSANLFAWAGVEKLNDSSLKIL